MQLRVECYAGYRADQRPLCFYLGEKKLEVTEVLDRWYGPDDLYFRVRAEDGHLYILRHHERDDNWSLESFRRATAAG